MHEIFNPNQAIMDANRNRVMRGRYRSGEISGASKRRFLGAGTELVVKPGQNIQQAIDELERRGGGRCLLTTGTHTANYSISLKSNISIIGETQTNTILDFNSTANQIKVEGSDAYSTGTVSVSNGGTTVTGSGTSWSSNVSAGQSILLSGIWYPIAVVTNDTSITIGLPYAGSDLSGASYTVATTIEQIFIESLLIKGSNLGATKLQYANDVSLKNLDVQSSAIGIDGDDSAQLTLEDCNITANNVGVDLDNYHFMTMSGFGIVDTLVGAGIDLNGCTSSSIDSNFVLNSTGNGVSLTDCENISIAALFSIENGGIGLEAISGNSNIRINNSGIKDNDSDNLKLTATSDDFGIVNSILTGAGGYGINIAASSCDDNIILANNLKNNTSGAVNDSGTGTIYDATLNAT